MSKRQFFRSSSGTGDIIYQLSRLAPKNTLVPDSDILCPCCNQLLLPICDIIQWGMFDDAYTTIFVCHACEKAFWYQYLVSRIEIATDDSADGMTADIDAAGG